MRCLATRNTCQYNFGQLATQIYLKSDKSATLTQSRACFFNGVSRSHNLRTKHKRVFLLCFVAFRATICHIQGWQGALIALLRLAVFVKRGKAKKRRQYNYWQVFLTQPSTKTAKPCGLRLLLPITLFFCLPYVIRLRKTNAY